MNKKMILNNRKRGLNITAHYNNNLSCKSILAVLGRRQGNVYFIKNEGINGCGVMHSVEWVHGIENG
jgi:hypothetical protein